MEASISDIRTRPNPDLLVEARKVLAEAGRRGLSLRLMGGVAVLCRCPSAARPPLDRAYHDIDFMGKRKESGALISVFEDLGYVAEPRFNSLHGHSRLLFKTTAGEHRDILLDRFEMCHNLDLSGRLEIDTETLTLADLLLMKLQVVRINAKDLTDLIALIADHACGEGHDEIDAGYIARLCANDWGLERTITESAHKVVGYADEIGFDRADVVRGRVAMLLSRLDQEPKSRRWKMRAKVGERVKWYELPEEIS